MNNIQTRIMRWLNGKMAAWQNSEDQVERAFAEYEHNERGEENSDKVLVSINNVKKISEIYPNYFVQLEKIASTLDDLLDYAE